MEYDGVNGVVMFTTKQGTDGSRLEGQLTDSWIRYVVTMSGTGDGITGLGWPNGLFDESEDVWSLYASQGVDLFNARLQTFIGAFSGEEMAAFMQKYWETCKAF